MPTDLNLPADVIRLVCAAREVAFIGTTSEALKELDAASEAFADRVEWEDEPEDDDSPFTASNPFGERA